MKTKLILSALGIVAMLTSPAFAQQAYRPGSQFQAGSGYVDQNPRSGSAASDYQVTHGFYANER